MTTRDVVIVGAGAAGLGAGRAAQAPDCRSKSWKRLTAPAAGRGPTPRPMACQSISGVTGSILRA